MGIIFTSEQSFPPSVLLKCEERKHRDSLKNSCYERVNLYIKINVLTTDGIRVKPLIDCSLSCFCFYVTVISTNYKCLWIW